MVSIERRTNVMMGIDECSAEHVIEVIMETNGIKIKICDRNYDGT